MQDGTKEMGMSLDNLASASTVAVVNRIKANAVRRAGVDDFGPSDFEKPLAMIVEGGASKPGADFWLEEVENALVGRLVREAEWKRHPEYRTRPISEPLVICGMPRTGTTALHKLLSVDPQFQGLDHWLTTWPKPRPPRAQWENEPGFQNAVRILEKRFANHPGQKISHDVVADEVDECLEILRLDFVTNRFPSMTSIPEYDRWYQQQDETPYYRRLADTIRLIGLHDDRTWLLKNPGHFGHLDSLFAVFPDARVVITHRDPMKSIPSLCSVLSHSHLAMEPNADLKAMAHRELDYWETAKVRTEAVRKQMPREQLLDVDHADFHNNPMGTVKRIYSYFGITLSPEAEGALEGWIAANPKGKHGEHTYDLATYGLDEREIRRRFGEG